MQTVGSLVYVEKNQHDVPVNRFKLYYRHRVLSLNRQMGNAWHYKCGYLVNLFQKISLRWVNSVLNYLSKSKSLKNKSHIVTVSSRSTFSARIIKQFRNSFSLPE